MNQIFGGLRIVIDDPKQRRRMLMERLFSWPWQPWEKWIVEGGVPDGEVIRGHGILVMSSRTKDQMNRELQNQ